jgi:hypothetical protein
MQPPKKYKFLQEQVFEGVWPFNKFQSPTSVFLLTLIYFIWGLSLYIYYDIPPFFFITGISGAFGIFLWTIGIFRYADRLRDVEIEEINVVNKKFLIGFLENLFHPSSIVLGVIMFCLVSTYYFSSVYFGFESLLITLQKELNTVSLPPLLLCFVFLMTFDLSYRLGLSTYVILMQIRRNLRLAHYLEDPHLKTYFSPRDLKNLEKTDVIHILAISGSILLLPIVLFDIFLFTALIFFIIIILVLTVINIFHLRILYLQSIPQKILDLLSSAKIAKIGTLSHGRSPHITPTLFVYDGRSIFVATSSQSRKIENLSHFKEIAIFIDHTNKNDLTKSIGVLITGQPRVYGYNILTKIFYIMFFGFRLLRIVLLFQKKYPAFLSRYFKRARRLPKAWQLLPTRRTFIEILPERFLLWNAKTSTFKQI